MWRKIGKRREAGLAWAFPAAGARTFVAPISALKRRAAVGRKVIAAVRINYMLTQFTHKPYHFGVD